MYFERSDAINLNDEPRLRLKDFKKCFSEALRISRLLEEEAPEEYRSGYFTLSGIRYNFTISVLTEHIGKEKEFYLASISLEWDIAGRRRTQVITLDEKKSNLGLSSYYYFLIPSSGTARILYQKQDGTFVGRKGLERKAHYLSQHINKYETKKKDDTLKFYFHLLELEKNSPYRAKGKRYYRGNLTRYGKRLQKYEDEHSKALEKCFKALNRSKGTY